MESRKWTAVPSPTMERHMDRRDRAKQAGGARWGVLQPCGHVPQAVSYGLLGVCVYKAFRPWRMYLAVCGLHLTWLWPNQQVGEGELGNHRWAEH